MKKEIKWVFEGKDFEGFATLEDGIISMCDERGNVFDNLSQDKVENGMTLEEIFEEIPEDVTDFALK